MDPASRRVWRGDVEIELTAREYALLEYLAHREGQVVSRADIWEQLNTRCLSIAGGTTQILRNVAGERILGLPR